MTLIDRAAALTDEADLVIMANVETVRDQLQPATASAVASLIGGAPEMEVARRLQRLYILGVLDQVSHSRTLAGYQLNDMGCELLMRELIEWSPSAREQGRRDVQLSLAAARGLRL